MRESANHTGEPSYLTHKERLEVAESLFLESIAHCRHATGNRPRCFVASTAVYAPIDRQVRMDLAAQGFPGIEIQNRSIQGIPVTINYQLPGLQVAAIAHIQPEPDGETP